MEERGEEKPLISHPPPCVQSLIVTGLPSFLIILSIGQFEIQNTEQFAALLGTICSSLRTNVRTNHTENTAVRTNHTENTDVTNQKDFRIYKQSFQKGEIVL